MINLKQIILALIISLFVITPIITTYSHAQTQSTPRDYDQEQKELKKKENQGCISTKELKEKWNKKCYSCIVVAQVIDAFMNGAAKLYPITSEAGTKILVFGFIIWAGLWGLKNLATLTAGDGGKMTWEVLIMLFKVGCAYIAINIGIGILVGYFITPILDAGADYANKLLEENSAVKVTMALTDEEEIQTKDSVISTKTLNKILLVAKTASTQVTTVMVVGSAINCYAWENPLFKNPWYIPVNIRIENFIMIILAMIMWFIGFMLAMAICFYLLDLSFKLGFAVLLLPIAIGLWPFPVKSINNKVGSCIGIALNAAGLFIMIAITVSLAIVMVDNAFQTPDTPAQAGGIEELFTRIDKDDKEYIANVFDISEPYVFILLFCLIAGFKIIGKSDKYANTVFSSELAGLNPMHKATTGMVDKVTSPVRKLGKIAGNIAAHQTGKALMKGGNAAVKGTKKAAQAVNNRFIAPTTKAAKKGFAEGFTKGGSEAFQASQDFAQNFGSNNPLQQRSTAETVARNTAGVVMGAVAAPVAAIGGSIVGGVSKGAQGWFKNEKKQFKNMTARVSQSSNEVIANAVQTGNSFYSAAKALKNITTSGQKKDALKQAFSHAYKGSKGVIKTSLSGFKVIASTTKTSSQILNKASEVIAGDPKKRAQNASQRRKTLKEKAHDKYLVAAEKHRENKERGGILGKIKGLKSGLDKAVHSTIEHKLGFVHKAQEIKRKAGEKIDEKSQSFAEQTSFDKESIESPELKRLMQSIEKLQEEIAKLKEKNESDATILQAELKLQEAETKLQKHKKLLEETDLSQYDKRK